MANETTASVQSAYIATEVISQQAINSHGPRMVMFGLVAHDSMDGAGSGTKKIPVNADLGASSAGSEGVDLTPTVALTASSSVSLTPTEGVADMALITDDVVMRRLGGTMFQTVRSVFESGNKAAISSLLAPDIRRLTKRALQKIEADALALLSGPATSVGTSTNDLSLTNVLEAVWQMKKNQPLRPPTEWGFVFSPDHVHHLNTAAVATSGGVEGTLWGSGRADYNLANNPGDQYAVNGLIGSILGYRAYEYDNELKVTANAGADSLSGFLCLGAPNRSSESYDGDVPYGVYCERHFINFAFQADQSLRSLEIIMNARYIFGELADLNGVKIVGDYEA